MAHGHILNGQTGESLKTTRKKGQKGVNCKASGLVLRGKPGGTLKQFQNVQKAAAKSKWTSCSSHTQQQEEDP